MSLKLNVRIKDKNGVRVVSFDKESLFKAPLSKLMQELATPMTRVDVNGTLPFYTLVTDPQYFRHLEQVLVGSTHIALKNIGVQTIPDAMVQKGTSGNKCLQYVWFVKFSTKDPKSESDAIVQLADEISTATQQFAVEHPEAQVFNVKADRYDKFCFGEPVVGVAISWLFRGNS